MALIEGKDKVNDNLEGTQNPDLIKGKGGNDVLQGNAGDDFLLGGKGNDELNGDGEKDTILGGDGKDILTGGFDADTLTGGKGKDTFRFLDPTDRTDTITDFSVKDDSIFVDSFTFGFGMLNPGTNKPITADQFHIGAAADDTNQRFIYDQVGTGTLWFDVDGMGGQAAQPIVNLQTGLNLTNADIITFTM